MSLIKVILGHLGAFEASLGYMRPCLKRKKKTQHNHSINDNLNNDKGDILCFLQTNPKETELSRPGADGAHFEGGL